MKSSRVGDILYLVVPCYNEEEVLEHTAEVMKNKQGNSTFHKAPQLAENS